MSQAANESSQELIEGRPQQLKQGSPLLGLVFFQADNWREQCSSREEQGVESETQASILDWTSGEYPNGEQWVKLLDGSQQFETIHVLARFKASSKEEDSGQPLSLADQTMRLVLLLEVLRRRGQKLKLFLPYLPYSLQDRDVHGGDAIGSASFIRLIEAMGVDEVQVVDLHSPLDLTYFTMPVKHLSAESLLAQRVREVLPTESITLVAPDKGAAHKAHRFAERLDVPVTYLNKKRLGPGEVILDTSNLKELKAQEVLLVDDLLNTGGTLVAAVQAIREEVGVEVSVVVTHALFVNGALEKLIKAGVKKIIVTDSYGYKLNEGDVNKQLEEVSVFKLFETYV